MSKQTKKLGDSFPRNTLLQCEAALRGWDEMKDNFEVPGFSIDDFRAKVEEATMLVNDAEALKKERAKAVKNRNDSLRDVWDLTKRIRNAGKATFGDESVEVEKLGVNTPASRHRRHKERMNNE